MMINVVCYVFIVSKYHFINTNLCCPVGRFSNDAKFKIVFKNFNLSVSKILTYLLNLLWHQAFNSTYLSVAIPLSINLDRNTYYL